MANYYTQYSQEYTFPTVEAANFFHQMLVITQQAHRNATAKDGSDSISPEQYKTALEEAVAALATEHDLSAADRDSIIEFIVKNDEALEDCCDVAENAGVENDRVWVYNTAGCSSEAAMIANMLQHTQNRFGIEQPYSIEYADMCDRPRTDAFGGGALVVTPKEIHHQTTYNWINEKIKELQAPSSDNTEKPSLDLLITNNDGDMRIYASDPKQINNVLLWESSEESGFTPNQIGIEKLSGSAEIWNQELDVATEQSEFNFRLFLEDFISKHS